MSYASIKFILFVAVTAILYFVLPLKKNKWIVLLIASYIFYLFAGYKYIAFIVFTTVSTYFIARWLEYISVKTKDCLKANKELWDREKKKHFKNKTKIKKRWILALALILNFGILAFLKYYDFFAGSLNDIFGRFGLEFSVPTLRLFLPLGISFYTFQAMGYIVDVYREKFPAERNLAKFALFVSFFPQIVQGPISFYDQLAHQLYEPHKVDFTRIKFGCELLLWGFFKKLVIADRAVIVINTVTNNYNSYLGTTLTWIVLIYALQLYADFSGGIDISRGVAQVLGIDLTENFRRPYFSKTINEYWRRWHITLGAWMKEYLFYPLSLSHVFLNMSKKIKTAKIGSTKVETHIAKVLPTAIASLIVFLVVGVWHGASWKYVAFGLWNGGVIMFSTLFKPLFDTTNKKLHINPCNMFWKLFQMIRTFIIVCIGYVFDIAPSFKQAMWTFSTILFKPNMRSGTLKMLKLGISVYDYIILLVGAVVILCVSVLQERGINLRKELSTKRYWLRWGLSLGCIITIILFGVYGPSYDASSFVYMQF